MYQERNDKITWILLTFNNFFTKSRFNFLKLPYKYIHKRNFYKFFRGCEILFYLHGNRATMAARLIYSLDVQELSLIECARKSALCIPSNRAVSCVC